MSTRNWGMITALVYAVMVILLLMPGIVWMAGDAFTFDEAFPYLFDADFAIMWIWTLALLIGYAMLFLVTVDRTNRRLPPRRHIAFSVITITLTIGLLAAAATASILAAIWGDQGDRIFVLVPAVWAVCAVVFFLYRCGLSKRLDRVLTWLIAGSVIELLIAVPCHIVVRQRNDCCAPGITAIGIATGIAVMLMAVGPAVYFLYRRKLDQYSGPIPSR